VLFRSQAVRKLKVETSGAARGASTFRLSL
jgi:hypothetical protein